MTINYKIIIWYLLCTKYRFEFENKASRNKQHSTLEVRTTKEMSTHKNVASCVPTNSDENCCNSDLDLADFETCALSSDNLLLAGTQVKNTDQVFAVCVYGGAETKVKW